MKNIVDKAQANEELTGSVKSLQHENTELKEINQTLKTKAEYYEK
jgi:hypothetical protein